MRRLLALTASTAAALAVLSLPATAEDQVITAQVANTVTIDSAPADTDLGTLPASAASIGSITVSANSAYTLSVKSDVATMTGWDGAAYNSNSLASPMVVAPSLTSGSGTALAPVTVATTNLPIATNALSGLLSTTDVYGLTVTQPATALDPADSYRMVLTYTASLGI